MTINYSDTDLMEDVNGESSPESGPHVTVEEEITFDDPSKIIENATKLAKAAAEEGKDVKDNPKVEEANQEIRKLPYEIIEFAALQKEAPHDLLDMLHNPEKMKHMTEEEVERFTEQVKAIRERERKFNESTKEITDAKDIATKAERARDFLGIVENDPQNLNFKEAARLFYIFDEAKNHDQVIDLYEKSGSEIFKHNPDVRLAVARAHKDIANALLYTEGVSKDDIILADSHLSQSQDIIQSLIDEGEAHAESYKVFGDLENTKKLSIIREKEEHREGVKDLYGEGEALAEVSAAEAFKTSLEYLEKGYQTEYRYDAGAELAAMQLKNAAEYGEFHEAEKAVQTGRMAYLSAMKAGGLYVGEPTVLSAMVISSAISGKLDTHALTKLVELKDPEDVHEIEGALKRLSDIKDSLSSLEGLDSQRGAVEAAISSIQSRTVEVDPNLTSEEIKRRESTEKLFEKLFTYGEFSTTIGGAVELGRGDLQGGLVNRWDFAQARKLLEKSNIDQEENIENFLKIIDERIRAQYKTGPLEQIDAPYHNEEHDSHIKSLNEQTGIRKGDDSRTSIIVQFLNGIGDCRPHAYTKQLFFETWKSVRMNMLLKEAESLRSDPDAFDAKLAEAKTLSKKVLGIIDGHVNTPIELISKYQPKSNPEGRLIKSDKPQNVEDHTMNILATLDDDGYVTHLRPADSFYQRGQINGGLGYNFSGREKVDTDEKGNPVPGGKVRPALTLDINDVEGGFKVGTLDVIDPLTGKEVSVDIEYQPTSYTKRRELRIKDRLKDDTGAQYVGIPVSRMNLIDLDTNGDVINKTSESSKAFREKVRSLSEKKKKMVAA